MDEVLSAIRETQVTSIQEQSFESWNWDLISTILEVMVQEAVARKAPIC